MHISSLITNWRQFGRFAFPWFPPHRVSPPVLWRGRNEVKWNEVKWREDVFCFPPKHFCPFSQPHSACMSLYFPLTPSVSVSPCLGARLSRMDDADAPAVGLAASLHKHAEVLLVWPFAGACTPALGGSFDVNGNSRLREVWWKVSQPVFTPSQMSLNKLGEKTQIRFSQKGLM